ncbi:ArnT family glycosyltransferase [Candidatus Latescibacterota bacterium]
MSSKIEKNEETVILRISIICFVIFCGIMLYGIYHISFHIDEAWFGEQSYFQNLSGHVYSNFFEGMLNYENVILVRHKLFIYLGSLCIGLFGLNIVSLRIISVISAVLLFCLMYCYTRNENGKQNGIFLYSFLVLMFCPLFFRYTMLFRPELLLALIGFVVFFTVNRAVEQKNIYYVIISGIAAGIAVLVHLNGLMFVVGGASFYIFERQYRKLFLYLTAACLIASLYAYDIVGNVDLFLYQFRMDPALESRDFEMFSFLTKLFDEHTRYFRKPEIIFISTLYLFSLVLNAKIFRNINWKTAVFTLTSFSVLGIIAQSNTTKYAIPLFPYFALEIAYSIKAMKDKYHSIRRIILRSFSFLLLLMVLYGMIQNILILKFDVFSTIKDHKYISKTIPYGSTVLAPMFFMFDEIVRYKIVSLYWAEKNIKDMNKPFDWNNIERFAREHSANYIILNKKYLGRINYISEINGLEITRTEQHVVYSIDPCED